MPIQAAANPFDTTLSSSFPAIHSNTLLFYLPGPLVEFDTAALVLCVTERDGDCLWQDSSPLPRRFKWWCDIETGGFAYLDFCLLRELGIAAPMDRLVQSG